MKLNIRKVTKHNISWERANLEIEKTKKQAVIVVAFSHEKSGHYWITMQKVSKLHKDEDFAHFYGKWYLGGDEKGFISFVQGMIYGLDSM